MSKSSLTEKPPTLHKTSIHRDPVSNGRDCRRLVQLQLQATSRLPHLAAAPAADVTSGSMELYNRLDPRDHVDSMYCTTLVALQNAVMASFAEATTSRERNEHLAHAYEGIALFIEAVSDRESRRALIDDTRRREDVLNQLIKRYASETTGSFGMDE
jgi:hypothetical protein